MNKSIAIYIGSRTDYGLLFPIIDEINNHPDLEYLLIASGVLENSNYNYFIGEIEDDGFDISCQINLPDLKGLSMINSYNSLIISDVNKSLQLLEPDLLLVIDDSPGSLASAQTAFFLNIPVIHLHTRPLSGKYHKDAVRSAISKLSSIHISPDEGFTKYLLNSDESQKKFFTVGSPAIEACEIFSDIKISKITEKYKLNIDLPIIIYCYESPFEHLNQSLNNAKTCLDTLKESGYQTIITFPEPSPGRDDFIELLTSYKATSNFQIHEIIGYKDYIELIKICSLIIGNSTKWALESNYFKKILLLTDINIDKKSLMKNIVNIDITNASLGRHIERTLSKKDFKNGTFTEYTFENTGEKIADFISKLKLT